MEGCWDCILGVGRVGSLCVEEVGRRCEWCVGLGGGFRVFCSRGLCEWDAEVNGVGLWLWAIVGFWILGGDLIDD